jgi:hypothetical protein
LHNPVGKDLATSDLTRKAHHRGSISDRADRRMTRHYPARADLMSKYSAKMRSSTLRWLVPGVCWFREVIPSFDGGSGRVLAPERYAPSIITTKHHRDVADLFPHATWILRFSAMLFDELERKHYWT